MRGIVVLCVLGLLAVRPGPAAGAPDEPSPAPDAAAKAIEKEVERLLAELTSDDFAVREKARPRLEALAPMAHGVLSRRKDDPDPEVRRTVRSLLESVTPSAAEAPAPPVDLSEVGTVAFSASGTTAEVLAKWEATCGGRFRLPSVPAAGPALTVEAAKRPYFEALDAVLALASLEAADGFDEAGIARLVARDPGAVVPRAATGAFRLDVEQVHAIRDFRAAGRMKYALALRALWSPSVQVVTYSQPQVSAAVDDAGKSWRPLDPQVTVQHGAAGGRRSWNELRVGLEAPEGPLAKSLAEVRVSMRFRLRYSRQEIRFDDPAGMTLPATRAAPARTDAAGEVKVSLDSFGPDPEAQGWSLATLSVRLPPSVPADRLGVSLDAATGDPRLMYDRADRVSGSDGVLKLAVRAPGSRGEANPKAVRVTWYAREGEAAVPFVLRGIPLP